MVSLLAAGEKALSEPHIVIESVEAVYDAADGVTPLNWWSA